MKWNCPVCYLNTEQDHITNKSFKVVLTQKGSNERELHEGGKGGNDHIETEQYTQVHRRQ
jgi:hypothetical protein